MDLRAADAAHIYAAGRDLHIGTQLPQAPAAALRTLPRDTTVFTGRRTEVEHVLASASSARGPGLHVVSGMPGVGKTALVVHIAHRLVMSYPCGQLFVRLHAHTPGQQPADPADVLGSLLVGLGVDPRHLPHGLDARSRLWRDRLAGRRMLIVLDDAASRAQVEPLLPGDPNCLVMITSRRRLTFPEGAASLALGVLSSADASLLFTRLAGREARPAQSDAVAQINQLCGRLPLAIALLASRIAHRPHWDLAALARELACAQDRLEELAAGDLATAAAFAMSYRALPSGRRRLFRLLGLHPGPDIDAYAAAALTGTPLAAARRELEALYDDHLVDSERPGRYRLHDLLRMYARAAAGADPAQEHTDAIDRLMDYYGQAAAAACRHDAAGIQDPLPLPEPAVAVPEHDTYQDAVEWMRMEHANLIACAWHAAETGKHTQTFRLAATLADFLHHSAHWEEAARLHKAAVRAALAARDQRATATALYNLGRVHSATGNFKRAATLLRAAARRAAAENLPAQADALCALGQVRFAAGAYPDAVRLLHQALNLHRAGANRLGEADALWALGRVHDITSDFAQAAVLAQQALDLYTSTGHEPGQAKALWLLSRIRHMTGHYSEADRLAGRALNIYRRLRERTGEANALWELGRAACGRGDQLTAGHFGQQALTLYQTLGDRLGEASALWLLSRILLAAQEAAAAEDLAQQAHDLYRRLGNQHGEANALLELGRAKTMSQHRAEAIALLTRSRELFRAAEDIQGEAEALNSSGDLLAVTDIPRALVIYEQALHLARQASSPKDQAHALEGAACCHLRRGQRSAALACWAQALSLHQRMGTQPALATAFVLAPAQSSMTGDNQQ
ncbi:tetratricopeptide repeat protein [Streptomyces sp. HC44]|uniref:Tetratricopeptide repeat protein n=1 Tax=Streptomyces scabichelini TaxID=2711217 RepID=A0A6G4V089_9ACTN|nr:tetratricopeptide repeat protein [Streptomyces scabichelini]NGO07320.1 tetratricopeptide repeat protein [Streptomyces scabichelini]